MPPDCCCRLWLRHSAVERKLRWCSRTWHLHNWRCCFQRIGCCSRLPRHQQRRFPIRDRRSSFSECERAVDQWPRHSSLGSRGAVTIIDGALIDGDIVATGAITLNANSHLSGAARCTGVLTIGLGASVGSASPSAPVVATLSADKPLDPNFAGNLIPGTYTSGSAAACATPVTLDCQFSNTAVFKFIIGGALSFNSNVQMINGNCKATWTVDGAASLAAGVSVDGNIEATGAINLGAGARLNGCARAGGALNLGAGASVGCAAMFSTASSDSLKLAVKSASLRFNEANDTVETDKTTAYIVGFVGLGLIIVLTAVIVVMVTRAKPNKASAAPKQTSTTAVAVVPADSHSITSH